MEIYNVEEPKLGIILYRNAVPENFNLPERLEASLQNSIHDLFKWKKAMVGYNEEKIDYRDCVDLKIGPNHWQYLTEEFKDVKGVYDDYNSVLQVCLNDYEKRFNFKMNYMEAINFVRYGEGQHFSVHTDDGFSYSCTLSSVGYLNDEYEGGEIWFPNLNLKFKPQKGDILFFPSTYIYAHSALPVSSGIKYSAVTMFDYNDNNHKIINQNKEEENDGSGILRRINN